MTIPGSAHEALMKREWQFWVYIMSSKSRRIYTGMTNDIERRVHEHKSGLIEGFTRKYRIDRLVYLERFHYVTNAIHREKEIKGLDRKKRVALIASINPTWDDLSLEWGKPTELLHPSTADEQQIPRCARDDNSERASGATGSELPQRQTPRFSTGCASDDNFEKSGGVPDYYELLTTKT
jgi:putative endonuclease